MKKEETFKKDNRDELNKGKTEKLKTVKDGEKIHKIRGKNNKLS